MGEALGLFVPAERGRVVAGMPMTYRVAGSELNTAVALARLEVPSVFAGAVGDDPVGLAVRNTLRGEGAGDQYLTVGEAPTGLMIQEFYGLDSEPRVYYFRQGTAMHDWAPPAALVEDMDAGSWLHLSGITWMIHRPLAERLSEWLNRWCDVHPRRFSLDINMRRRLGDGHQWRTELQPALERAGLIFCARADLVSVFGIDSAADLWVGGVLAGEQVLVVTDGPNGSRAYQGGVEIASAPAVPVSRVVDVVGAGDGFSGGVLAGLFRGWDYARSLALGAVVGAFAVTHPGDFEGYPTWQEADAVLNNRWVDR